MGEPLLHFYPRSEPTPLREGDRALCGHVRTKPWDGQQETGERCVVCEELLAAEEASAG